MKKLFFYTFLLYTTANAFGGVHKSKIFDLCSLVRENQLLKRQILRQRIVGLEEAQKITQEKQAFLKEQLAFNKRVKACIKREEAFIQEREAFFNQQKAQIEAERHYYLSLFEQIEEKAMGRAKSDSRRAFIKAYIQQKRQNITNIILERLNAIVRAHEQHE